MKDYIKVNKEDMEAKFEVEIDLENTVPIEDECDCFRCTGV